MASRLTLVILLITGLTSAQIVTSLPPYPTENDSIIVYFDATYGNRGLLNYTGDVYAHTGVITNLSTQPSDWRYVVTPWPGSGGTPNLVKNKLIRISTNLYKLVIGYPRTYYVDHLTGRTIPSTEKILKLAFVFRNADGSKEGKDVGNADIFLPLYEEGLNAIIEYPAVDLTFGDPYRTPYFCALGDTFTVRIRTTRAVAPVDSIKIDIDQNGVATFTDSTASYLFDSQLFGSGPHRMQVIAIDQAGVKDTTELIVMVNPPVPQRPVPAGVLPGVTIHPNSSITFCLQAPRKNFVYLIGDCNDWRVDTAFYMYCDDRGGDDVFWWRTLPDINTIEELGYQYLVDGNLRVADPYARLVLDGWNDQYISSTTYPNLKSYPAGKTKEIVSVVPLNATPFTWEEENFMRPPKQELIIYELLIRDFVAAHNFSTLKDTLDYFVKLGINAIELMPVTEFEGNSSWGYNPSFFFAVDKYYGPANTLKELVQACHQRGIAVILDIVLNHAFGQNPLVRLYWDTINNRPAIDNPWFNPTDHHPYGVGYDFNHESPATRQFAKRVLEYWLKEFHIDGFRFDLSKGFTQKFTYGNVSAWNAYDESRIAILKDYADHIWSCDSTAYVILEHFAENREEIELANYGMLLWGNVTHDYQEAAMGWGSDFTWSYYANRQWTKPHLITYLESHDEERLMYKNLQWGNAAGSYDIKQLPTALNRIKLVAAFFFTLPGPKMFWQFGELGYDYSIDYNGRLGEKPIRWDYLNDPRRLNLYKTFAALIKLRQQAEVFRKPNQNVLLSGYGYQKSISMSGSPNAVISGNFNVSAATVTLNFAHGGNWFDYFSGDTLSVEGNSKEVTLKPGEFRIYTDVRLEPPEPGILTEIAAAADQLPQRFRLLPAYPNPFNNTTHLQFEVDRISDLQISIIDILGREILKVVSPRHQPGRYLFSWNGCDAAGLPVESGTYFVCFKRQNETNVQKVTLLK